MSHSMFEMGDGIYLLNHSVGRLPKSTPAYLEKHFFSPWREGTPDPWGQWMGVFNRFQQALSALFHSQSEQFCPQVNLSSGLSKLFGALPTPISRKTVLMTENDFPSMGFVARQSLPEGYDVRFIPKSEDVLDPDVWSHYLTDDVVAVFITHSHYNTSKLTPVSTITRMAHERDILSIVDVAQSSGVVPIDLTEWRADIVLGSCVKWLCGGPGAGFIWFNKASLTRFEPKDVGWFSHKNPFEFDINHFEYADDASRFWGGTPSVMPYVVATNGIETLLNIGIEKIRRHNQTLTQHVVDNVPDYALVSPTHSDKRGGTLVLKFQQQDAVADALNCANVKFDVRPLGMRLSPHIYTSRTDIDKIIEILGRFD